MEFKEFPKMARLSRECIITEKIDGTNAQILIEYIPKPSKYADEPVTTGYTAYKYGEDGSMWGMWVGSRTRWVKPGDDNFGFAAWCYENKDELFKLGPGQHFGEWWGKGIQRGYGLNEKRFSLFNTTRWNKENIPGCVSVVPEFFRGTFTTDAVEGVLWQLKENGSLAAPGFMKPEGVVVYHVAAGIGFKKTIEKDEQPKGKQGG